MLFVPGRTISSLIPLNTPLLARATLLIFLGLFSACRIGGDVHVQETTSGASEESTSEPSVESQSVASIEVLAGHGQTGAVGQPLALPLSVGVVDGAAMPVEGATINWVITSGSGALSSSSSTTDANGSALATFTLGNAVGDSLISATVDGSSLSVSFTATAVAGAAASIEIIDGNNSSGLFSTQLSTPLQVRVKDTYGNPVPSAGVTWAITSGGGSLSATSSSTSALGVTSSSLTLGDPRVADVEVFDSNGSNTVTAAISNGSSVTFTHTSVVCAGANLTNAPFAAGTGASNDPYYICTSTQLNQISGDATNVTKSYKLGATINLSGVAVNLIGNPGGAPFSGKFNGNGYQLLNLTINASADAVGLFTLTSPAAKILNISLSVESINAGAYNDVGSLVGYSNGSTIADCEVSKASAGSTVTGGSWYAGGLVGSMDGGTISRSSSELQVTGATGVGGLVGNMTNGGIITDSYARGDVTLTAGFGGGLVGNADNGTSISRSYSTGAVGGAGGGEGLTSGGAATVSDSFWDTETSGKATDGNAGTVGKTTAQMKTAATFTGAGWDNASIWNIANGSYPTLR